VRLDKYLVEQGYFESRNRALEAIRAGKVCVDGKVAKASTKVNETLTIEVEEMKFYVSRAARKLEGFLADYPLSLVGMRALDIGSSTGGFAQILLEQGVKKLSCVDVGKEQLHHSLRENSKITLFEETDIRHFKSSEVYDVITCDVSFISILHIIEDIERLSTHNTEILILYKPQFEVGKEVKRDSKGVVVDSDAITRVKEKFEQRAKDFGWQLQVCKASRFIGKEGNQEYMYHFKKGCEWGVS
jgi:23S rRNA (cytidine1920-2'-O)/16S rRNA (cytidine1409-2'-O)-methyltransferase